MLLKYRRHDQRLHKLCQIRKQNYQPKVCNWHENEIWHSYTAYNFQQWNVDDIKLPRWTKCHIFNSILMPMVNSSWCNSRAVSSFIITFSGLRVLFNNWSTRSWWFGWCWVCGCCRYMVLNTPQNHWLVLPYTRFSIFKGPGRLHNNKTQIILGMNSGVWTDMRSGTVNKIISTYDETELTPCQ